MSSISNKDCTTRISKSTEFEIGDMVWGKVKSHPWWPGYILDESIALPSVFENKVNGFTLVAFFGDGSYGWLDSSDLIPYASNFLEKSKQTTMKNFVKAVDESVDEFSRRAALGISCKCRNSNNFRVWNTEDYFSVDVAGFEPNGIYDRRQIELARSDFRSKNMIDFLKNLAMSTGEVVNNDMDMDSVRDLAKLNALRRSLFVEKDPTLVEAFGAVSGKQAEEKYETSAKKDEAKKGIESLKKGDQYLKRSSQQHSTLKLKGSSASTSLPKPFFSSQKQPKLLEEKSTGAADESTFDKAPKTSKKHKIENVNEQAEGKTKKHKNVDDQVEGKSKKHKRQVEGKSTLITGFPSHLPDLLSLAKDQFYGEEQNIAMVIHDLFLKFRSQTYLNIFDKAGLYQVSKPHPTGTTSTKLDGSKSFDKAAAYNQEPKSHSPITTLKKFSKPTTLSSKKLDESKRLDKPIVYNQELNTLPESSLEKADEASGSKELKTHHKPSSKPTAEISKKVYESKSLDKSVGYSQELKSIQEPSSKKGDEVGSFETHPKPSSKPNAKNFKRPDDLKNSDKPVAYNLELKTAPVSSSQKPNEVGASEELKTQPEPSSKPTAKIFERSDDLKSLDKTVFCNQELKSPSVSSSGKPNEVSASEEGKTHPKPSSKPNAKKIKRPDDLKNSDKPVAYNQELKTAPVSSSQKPNEVGASEELKTQPEPSSKPTAKNFERSDDLKSTDKTVSYNQELKSPSVSSSGKPNEVGASEELKTQPKPSSKPTAKMIKRTDDLKSSDKADSYNQELRSPPLSSSEKPNEVGASEELKTHTKRFPKSATKFSRKLNVSKGSDKPVAYNQELKYRLEPSSKKHDGLGASEEVKTNPKFSSKPTKRFSKKLNDSESSDKPTAAYKQELETPSKPSSKKPDEFAASEELKPRPKHSAKPQVSRSSDKPIACNQDESEEFRPEKSQKFRDTTKSSLKRPLPDKLIEATIKRAKLAQLKAREKLPEAAGAVPGKEECPTYLYLKFPRKSPLPSLSNLKVRFAQFKNMVVEGNKVMWKAHACRVQFRYRSDALEALHYAKSNYIFGQFEIECSLRAAVEEPKEKEKEKEEGGGSGPKSILKKGREGNNGSESGKDNQRVQFMLPSDDPSTTADVAMMRDMETGSAAFRTKSSVLSEERKEPPVQVSRATRETGAVHVSKRRRESGEDEEYKRTFLDLLTRCAAIVERMRATPGFALHHFLESRSFGKEI